MHVRQHQLTYYAPREVIITIETREDAEQLWRVFRRTRPTTVEDSMLTESDKSLITSILEGVIELPR